MRSSIIHPTQYSSRSFPWPNHVLVVVNGRLCEHPSDLTVGGPSRAAIAAQLSLIAATSAVSTYTRADCACCRSGSRLNLCRGYRHLVTDFPSSWTLDACHLWSASSTCSQRDVSDSCTACRWERGKESKGSPALCVTKRTIAGSATRQLPEETECERRARSRSTLLCGSNS